MPYDVIIAGQSFAGLAVASQLTGRVLLIDSKAIGEGQTSACGTLLGVPERLGLMETVLQSHPFLAFHTSSRTERYDVVEHAFCTFDYRRFCEGMAEATEAHVLRAAVTGVEGGEVVTDRGRFRGEILRRRGPAGPSLRLAADGDGVERKEPRTREEEAP